MTRLNNLFGLPLAAVCAVSACASVPERACNLSPLSATDQRSGRPRSAEPSHRQLRAKAGIAIPQAATSIWLHFHAAHHTSLKSSLVAVRQRGGKWVLDGVSDSGGGLLNWPSKLTHFVEPFTADEGRRLDMLLSDRCLTREPENFPHARSSDVGSPATSLEIHTPQIRRISAQFGETPGATGRVLDLLYEVASRGQRHAREIRRAP